MSDASDAGMPKENFRIKSVTLHSSEKRGGVMEKEEFDSREVTALATIEGPGVRELRIARGGARVVNSFANIERALEIDSLKTVAKEAREVMCIRDQVLILPCEKDGLSESGLIIIPDAAKQKPVEGLVIAVGPGKADANNVWVPSTVIPGDRVLFYRYGGTEIKLRGRDCRLMTEEDVQVVLR